MASVGLREILKVVDSTAQGAKARGWYYRPPRIFPITPQKPWVNQFVAHLHPLVAMHSMLTLTRHLQRRKLTFLDHSHMESFVKKLSAFEGLPFRYRHSCSSPTQNTNIFSQSSPYCTSASSNPGLLFSIMSDHGLLL